MLTIFKKYHLGLLLLLILILLVIALRYPLLPVTLERDEGEYAYGAQILLGGGLPYVDFYSMKLPGIYMLYAAILRLFGETHVGVHMGLLVVNILSICLVYLLVRRLFGEATALVSSCVFALLSLSQNLQGIFANTEHFINLFVLAAFTLLAKKYATAKGNLLIPGLFLGFALLIKQHAIFFIFLSFLVLLWSYRKGRNAVSGKDMAFFTARICLPLCLVLVYYLLTGNLANLLLWTFEYPADYISQVALRDAFSIFISSAQYVTSSTILLWGIGGLGLLLAILNLGRDKRVIPLLMYVIISLLSVMPGFYFRPHYFLLLLPATSILAGYAFLKMIDAMGTTRGPVLSHGAPLLVLLICIAITVRSQADYLFRMTPFQVSRSTYGINPFPESVDIARYLDKQLPPGETIAVVGSEPQVYFYTRRKAATGFIYMYPMMERHQNALRMQEHFINEIESSKPAYIVYVKIPYSWLRRADSHPRLFEWLNVFFQQQYTLDTVVEVLQHGNKVHQIRPSKSVAVETSNLVLVYRRNRIPGQ